MNEAVADSLPRRPLSQLLAEKPVWSLGESLALARRLALATEVLHGQGRIHRSLDATTVTVDGQLDPQLAPPAGPRRFGGDQGDPAFCPPELTGGDSVEVPEGIDAAADVLRKAGYALDPRRIDVYQLGVLLCQLVTGEPVLSYIYDATIKGRVPALAQPLLERTLGFESPDRFENCQQLVEALDVALRNAEAPEPSTSARDAGRGQRDSTQ